eukprot:847704-Rhodomonas_salina.3
MPPRKTTTAHPGPLPDLDKRHDKDHTPTLVPRASDLIMWLLALEGAGAVWNGQALRLGDVICTAVLYLDVLLPAYSTGAVRHALQSLDASSLPIHSLAIRTLLTSTIFLCKGFPQARALWNAILFDLSFGSPEMPSIVIQARGDLHCFRLTQPEGISTTAPSGQS